MQVWSRSSEAHKADVVPHELLGHRRPQMQPPSSTVDENGRLHLQSTTRILGAEMENKRRGEEGESQQSAGRVSSTAELRIGPSHSECQHVQSNGYAHSSERRARTLTKLRARQFLRAAIAG